MLIISEKRIRIILSLILISVFTFACSNVKTENNAVNKTVETTATPVSGKTVVLDARASEFLMKGLAYCIKLKIEVTIPL